MHRHLMLIFPLIMIVISFAGIALSEVNGLSQREITSVAAICVAGGFIICWGIASAQIKGEGEVSRDHKLLCNSLAESIGDEKPYPEEVGRRKGEVKHELDKTCK